MPKAHKFLPLLLLSLITIPSLALILDNKPGITHLNSIEAFQRTILTSDHLAVFLVCSEKVENCKLVEPIFADFANAMQDFVKIYAVICENLDPQSIQAFPICQEENVQKALPYITAYEPPTFQINPYTKQPAKPIEHNYGGNANVKDFSNFARQHMPVFRDVLSTKEALETFLSETAIPNKVILFTNKPQTSPLYKSLASEFRNRLLFGEINESAKDLIAEYQITKYPTIMVLKQQEDGTHKTELYEGNIDMEGLRKFLGSFALAEKAERTVFQQGAGSEQAKQSEQGSQQGQQGQQGQPGNKQVKIPQLNAANFETEVNKVQRTVLIYLSNSEEVMPLLLQVADKYGRFFEYFQLNCTEEANAEFARDRLNVRSFPSLVALPVGNNKRFNSRMLFSNSTSLQDVIQDVSDLVGDKLIPISAMEVQGVVTNSLTQKKPAFLYLYDGDDISVTYRMMAQLPVYQDRLTFTKLKNPPQEMYKNFEITKLPQLIAVVLHSAPGDDGDIDPQKVALSKYGARFTYEDLSRYFDTFLPEEERIHQTVLTKKVHEITTQAELDKACPPDTRVCVMGLINGYAGTEEAAAKKAEQLDVLNHVLKRHPHLNFVWVDALCHSELLLKLDIQTEIVPTVVVWSPVLKEYSQLVGMFEASSIGVFIDKVMKRRLSASTLSGPLTIEERDCVAAHETRIQQENAAAGGDDDEFMREFLEEQRRKQEEQDAAEGKKKRKKKSKKNIDDEL